MQEFRVVKIIRNNFNHHVLVVVRNSLGEESKLHFPYDKFRSDKYINDRVPKIAQLVEGVN